MSKAASRASPADRDSESEASSGEEEGHEDVDDDAAVPWVAGNGHDYNGGEEEEYSDDDDGDRGLRGLLEPQVLLGGPSGEVAEEDDDEGDDEDDDDDEEEVGYDGGEDEEDYDEGRCQVCSGDLAVHFGGRPCRIHDPDEGSNDDECQDGTPTPTSSQGRLPAKTKGSGKSLLALPPTCPICSAAAPGRKHLADHFGPEMAEVYRGLNKCAKCEFMVRGEASAKISRTLGLHHLKSHPGPELNVLLADVGLLQIKRKAFLKADDGKHHHSSTSSSASSSPGKVLTPASHVAAVPATIRRKRPTHCPVCDRTISPKHIRHHIADHFFPELKAMMRGAPLSCPLCPFRSGKDKDVTRHLAVAHWKLEELTADRGLVNSKRALLMGGVGAVPGVVAAHSAVAKATAAVPPPQLLQPPPPLPPSGRVASATLANNFIATKPSSRCPVCDAEDPQREHVSRHFIKELLEVVTAFPDPLSCPECDYRGEKLQKVARHIALVHSKLDEFLADTDLVQLRRKEYHQKPVKVNIGDVCPVCDQHLNKQHSRVHVIWHFMDDLKEIVSTFPTSTACGLCDYKNPNSSKVVKHVALGHSKLDEMLQDGPLLEKKRRLAKQKLLGSSGMAGVGASISRGGGGQQSFLCPICEVRNPDPRHLSCHFTEELLEWIETLPDQVTCSCCEFWHRDPLELGLHYAVEHDRLQILLQDPALVRRKRSETKKQPKQQEPASSSLMTPKCPICDAVLSNSVGREHIAWHFHDELQEYVMTFDNPEECILCDFTSPNVDAMIMHAALEHAKLEELLQVEELVTHKRFTLKAKPRKMPIGPVCPVCDMKEPSREHVARHFGDELMAVIADNPSPTVCIECDYKADKPKALSIHVALVHGKLEACLMDDALVASKKVAHLTKPKKYHIGQVCPICDLNFSKGQNRDHVSWHYMEELRGIVSEFEDPNKCPQCTYTADSNEKMVKHVALGHSMLDALLSDEALMQQKRIAYVHKPKKGSNIAVCPICDMEGPSREHVARHFGDELMDIVLEFEEPTKCTHCGYTNDKQKNVAIHVALMHGVLDHFLKDQAIVDKKREMYQYKPQKVHVGSQCPVCDAQFTKGQNRDHVCWHYIDELRDYVMSFPDTNACNECAYTSDKLDNLVKHVALGHSKLDALLQDEELLAVKREAALSKTKKVQVGSHCPICDIKFSKQQNRDHVASHFTDEIKDIIANSGVNSACQLCNYTSGKMENLVKHYALGHSKLDEFLLDEELVQQKRDLAAKKPKRLSFGPDCPICGAKGRDRDHVARHFQDELLEMVQSLPRPRYCNLCEYSSKKPEYLAKHLALAHCKLDEFMADKELVRDKMYKASLKPKKMEMIECIVCGYVNPNREHVARHFMKELLDLVGNFESPLSCPQCSFETEKAEYTARHLALVHFKLEALLQDEELVKEKARMYEDSPLWRKRDGEGSLLSAEEAGQSSSANGRGKPPLEAIRKSSRNKQGSHSGPTRSSVIPTSMDDNGLLKCERVKHQKRALEAPSPEVSAANPLRKLSRLESEGVRDRKKTHRQPSDDSSSSTTMNQQQLFNNNDSSSSRSSLSSAAVQDYEEDDDVDDEKDCLKDGNGDAFIKTEDDDEEESNIKSEDCQGGEGGTFSLLRSTLLNPKRTRRPSAMDFGGLNDPTMKIEIKDEALSPVSSLTLKKVYDDKKIYPSREGYPRDLAQGKGNSSITSSSLKMTFSASGKGSFSLIPNKDVAKKPVAAAMNKAKALSSVSLGSISLTPQAKGKAEFGLEKAVSTSALIPSTSENLKKMKKRSTGVERDDGPNPAPKKAKFDPHSSVAVGVSFVDKDEEGEDMMLEPQVILGDGTGSDDHQVRGDDGEVDDYGDDENQRLNTTAVVTEEDEFCDVCSMELINHPDELPCPQPLQGGSTRVHQVCPVCGMAKPSREHVARHYMKELKAVIRRFPEPLTCPECGDYTAETETTLALHHALLHSGLESLHASSTIKTSGSMKDRKNFDTKKYLKPRCQFRLRSPCPVCGVVVEAYGHVVEHFVEELHELIESVHGPQNNHNPSCTATSYACAEDGCGFVGAGVGQMVDHYALYHAKLDILLGDHDLVLDKRKQSAAASVPVPSSAQGSSSKAVRQCPVCDLKDPSREHITRHFREELDDYVSKNLPGHQGCCSQCNAFPQNLSKHVALVHNVLDIYLRDEKLVYRKRLEVLSRPKKVQIGDICPVCGANVGKRDSRVHVIWHFMDDLRATVQQFNDPAVCDFCNYSNPKLEKMAKHIALGHSRLDELLGDEALLKRKQEAAASKAKKINFNGGGGIGGGSGAGSSSSVGGGAGGGGGVVGSSAMGGVCPICAVQVSKQHTRDHISTHFMEELREMAREVGAASGAAGQFLCPTCPYKTGKVDSMAKHLALGHSKLDELLLDPALVAAKRRALPTSSSKARRSNNTQACPVCDALLMKSQVPEHVPFHFKEEFEEWIANEFADPGKCNLCSFSTMKLDAMIKHLAIDHAKLDDLVQDQALMMAKREEAMMAQ